MNSRTFNEMEPAQKMAMLDLAGTCLDQRYEPKYIVYLYRLYDVLIEVFYHHKDGFVSAEAVNSTRLGLYRPSPFMPAGLRGLILRMAGL